MSIYLILLMTIFATQALNKPNPILKHSDFNGVVVAFEQCRPITTKDPGEKIEIHLAVEKLLNQQTHLKIYDAHRRLIEVYHDIVGDADENHLVAGSLLMAPVIELEGYRTKHLELCLINVPRQGQSTSPTRFIMKVVQYQY